MIRILCALPLAVGLCLPAAGQTHDIQSPDSQTHESEGAVPKTALPAADIFSGTVQALTPSVITVIRKVVGQETVTRTFALNAETKVEGRLRLKARVAVSFKALDEGGFGAVHIIVR